MHLRVCTLSHEVFSGLFSHERVCLPWLQSDCPATVPIPCPFFAKGQLRVRLMTIRRSWDLPDLCPV